MKAGNEINALALHSKPSQLRGTIPGEFWRRHNQQFKLKQHKDSDNPIIWKGFDTEKIHFLLHQNIYCLYPVV